MEGAAQAGEPLRHGSFEFGAESFQLVGGKSAKEGLQDDFGFAKAGNHRSVVMPPKRFLLYVQLGLSLLKPSMLFIVATTVYCSLLYLK